MKEASVAGRTEPAVGRRRKGSGETLKVVVVAVLVALGVRTLAYEPFNIPSGSMEPTLLVGDFLFVSKFAYGYSRFSMIFSPPLFDGRIFADHPERGDVAVFKLPRDNSTDYVKRIIGLPGDRIQMRQGQLYVNGEAAGLQRAGTFSPDTSNTTYQRYIETLPSGRSYHVLHESRSGPLDTTPVYEVPENHYFAMGDNRDNSIDSRVQTRVGFIPEENLIGRADFLFFSLGGGTRFWEIWAWPVNLRYGRFFQPANPDVDAPAPAQAGHLGPPATASLG